MVIIFDKLFPKTYRNIAIKKSTRYIKNMFEKIDKLKIDQEDKFVIFRSYIEGLNDGIFIGIASLDYELGKDADIPLLSHILTVFDRYDQKMISVENAWQKIEYAMF